MPRGARRKSLTGYYHIIIRGNSKQIIFENDIDRVVFLKLLYKYRKEPGFKLVAYCLMSNHVHMIIHDINNKLDTIMKKSRSVTSTILTTPIQGAATYFREDSKASLLTTLCIYYLP